jgi:hypothetical protein
VSGIHFVFSTFLQSLFEISGVMKNIYGYTLEIRAEPHAGLHVVSIIAVRYLQKLKFFHKYY